MTQVLRLAAFSRNGQGGNPARVAFYDAMPSAEEMMSIAKEVSYSETAFLVKQDDGWRVRYFAPEMDIPFLAGYQICRRRHHPRAHRRAEREMKP